MLNDAQNQAVEMAEGPVRIIAGAGTGKTRVLVHRIAHLIEKGVKPWRVLALTFTNKAAHELRERLGALGHREVHCLTFHALAARMLRKHWRSDFKIVDPMSSRASHGHSEAEPWTAWSMAQPKNLPDDLVTSNLVEKEILLRPEADQNDMEVPQNDTELTFDELLAKFLEILPTIKNPFEHVMVDEYQDVNKVQIEILRQLVEPHHHVCVVGDPDQTIYSWRGSEATSLKDFETLFQDVQTVTLTQNYRNPPAILRGAELLIQHNPGRLPKELIAASQTSATIQHWKSESEAELFSMIIHLLEQKLGSHAHMHRADELDSGRTEGFYGFSDIAILYRTQEEGKRIAAALARDGYPYQMSAPENFWERKEIKTFLAELKNLMSFRASHGHSEAKPWTAGSMAKPKNLPIVSETSGSVKGEILLRPEADQNDIGTFSDWFLTRLNTFIENFKPSASQRARLDHLLNYALGCETLQSFLDEVALAQEADNLIQADRINLLTLHAAKGLEFPVVLIVGMEEGVLPHKKSDLEEERRLLYVGMTRATKELHLFSNPQKPSRFLTEIGRENLTPTALPQVIVRQLKRRTIKKAQMKLF